MSNRLLTLCSLIVVSCVQGEEVLLQEGTAVVFADANQARSVLTRQDEFVQALSPFDRQVRLMTDKPVSQQQYLAFVERQATDWKLDEVEKLSKLIVSIRRRVESFNLPFPPQILLVRTTGREESNAAYCRGNAVVLPVAVLKRQPDRLERLLVHELFHVLSSHNEPLRRRLYAVIGFEFCGAVELPAGWRDRKLTNPDAPVFAYRIRLRQAEHDIDVVPVLYASQDRYDVKKGGTLFQYLEFRLMQVERDGTRWRASWLDGKPVFLEPAALPSFFDRIGKNTRYIIHPDEILADNFVLLVMQSKSVATPRVINQLGEILRK